MFIFKKKSKNIPEIQPIIKVKKFELKKISLIFLACILILTVGISLYIFRLLGKPIHTKVPIITGGVVSEGILDHLEEIDDDDTNDSNSKSGNNTYYPANWGNGRVKLFVHPDFPIFKVDQKDPGVENILVFGVDARTSSERQSRTDSMLLISIDKNNNAIKLTSFMRDTEVKIPGRTIPAKLNAAYAYGGVGLLINTLNQNFDLDIQKFTMVDMLSSENIINAAGGVSIDVKNNELYYLNGGISETNDMFKKFSEPSPKITESGLQLLDGRQAVAYGRIRYVGSDQGRTLRQRTVLSALIISFKSSPLNRKMTVFNETFKSFETNMAKNDMLSLAFDVLINMKKIQQYRVPENGMFTTNTIDWHIKIDYAKQNPALHDFIWGNVPSNTITMPEEPVESINSGSDPYSGESDPLYESNPDAISGIYPEISVTPPFSEFSIDPAISWAWSSQSGSASSSISSGSSISSVSSVSSGSSMQSSSGISSGSFASSKQAP